MSRNNVTSRRNDDIGPAVFGEARLCRFVRSETTLDYCWIMSVEHVLYISPRVFNIFLIEVKSIYLSKHKFFSHLGNDIRKIIHIFVLIYCTLDKISAKVS